MRVYDIASVVGRFSGNFWMEATDFVYGDSHSGKFEKVGVVILIRSGDGYLNLGGFGREMLSKIHEEMKGLGVADGELVKELLASLIGMFPDVVVEISMFGVSEKKILLCGVGGGGASLVREGSLGKILSSTQHVNMVVGELKTGDVLVLASSDFYERVAYSDMRALLSQGTGEGFALASSFASHLAILVQDVPVGIAMSALVLVVSEKQEEKVQTKSDRAEMIKNWWKKIAGSGVYLKDRFGVDPKQRRHKRLGLLILSTLLIIFLVSLGVRARNIDVEKREKKVAEVVGPVRDLIREAGENSSINKLRSRSLLLSAKDLLTAGVNQFPEKSAERKLVDELLVQVQSDYEKISGEVKIEPEPFLDLSLVSSGFVGGALVVNGDRVLVLSDNSGIVIEVEAESKKAKILAGGTGASMIASGAGGDFVLTGEGVVKIDAEDKKTVIPKEDVWDEIVGFGAFGSNIYILDKGVGEIWKYTPTEGNYVSRRWLAAGVQPSFDKVVDMYIDGDIWVLDGDGVVRTYTGGVPKSVEMTGLSDTVSGAKSVVTTENRIWVLDRSGKRLVGYDREGVYQVQYLWDGFGLTSDVSVVVVGDRELLLLLSGEKIYEIGL